MMLFFATILVPFYSDEYAKNITFYSVSKCPPLSYIQHHTVSSFLPPRTDNIDPAVRAGFYYFGFFRVFFTFFFVSRPNKAQGVFPPHKIVVAYQMGVYMSLVARATPVCPSLSKTRRGAKYSGDQRW